jgi:pimeloyl-ACP methyl ester carboxylesterase
MSRQRSSVLFIHGLWLHPSSWAPWLRLFEERGYEASAPAWPGVAYSVEETRAHPDGVADRGIDEVAYHYLRIIDRMDDRPVIVGHSFGGIIGEMLLLQGRAAAAIAIGAAHTDGVPRLPFASLRHRLPLFDDPANRHRAVSLTAEQFRYGVANTLDRQESDELYDRWTIPAPGRPLFEATEEKFSLYSAYSDAPTETRKEPLLLISGGQDRAVPPTLTEPTTEAPPATDLLTIADRGHSLTIDHGWPEVAEACISWLWDEHDL